MPNIAFKIIHYSLRYMIIMSIGFYINVFGISNIDLLGLLVIPIFILPLLPVFRRIEF